GRIVLIKLFGEFYFLAGAPQIARFAPGFAQITSEEGALRFKDGGDLDVLTASLDLAAPDSAQAAPQPGIAQRAIDGHGTVEGFDCLADPVLGGQEKAFQGDGFHVARTQLQALRHGCARGGGSSETKFQFRLARPAEAEI